MEHFSYSLLARHFIFIITALILLSSVTVSAQDAGLAKYIQEESIIKEGGTELFEYKGQQYIISVAYLAVGTKSELDCKKVGQAKAKREMLSYINGSEITSYTELKTKEDTEHTLAETKVQASQEFTEVIHEKVIGVINQCAQLSGWYSDDKSVYYYALYKSIQ